MKRRRRSIPTKLLYMQARRLWNSGVIPPRSFVRLKDANGWLGERVFRIGYYRRSDGLDCVWLVNQRGVYEAGTDQKLIGTDFEVLERSDETDWYGDEREILPPIDNATPMAIGMA